MMIMTRTPLRVSLGGGGCDAPYEGGRVVSCTIDKHVYCVVKDRPDGRFIVNWSQKEDVDNASKIKHEIVRECIFEVGCERGGLEITFLADVPGRGSGLGSSAATCISCLHALALLRGWDEAEVTADWLARTAWTIQICRLEKSQGIQDECACAWGGLRSWRFEESIRSDLLTRPGLLAEMSLHYALYSPPEGAGRNAEAILKTYNASEQVKLKMWKIADAVETELSKQQPDWKELARQLYCHHEAKRDLTPHYCPKGMEGLEGLRWKLCGAGGTGHILVAGDVPDLPKADQILAGLWGPRLPFKFVPYGSKLVYRE